MTFKKKEKLEGGKAQNLVAGNPGSQRAESHALYMGGGGQLYFG